MENIWRSRCHGWRQVTTPERDCASVSKIVNIGQMEAKGGLVGTPVGGKHVVLLLQGTCSKINILIGCLVTMKKTFPAISPNSGAFLRRCAPITRTRWQCSLMNRGSLACIAPRPLSRLPQSSLSTENRSCCFYFHSRLRRVSSTALFSFLLK